MHNPLQKTITAILPSSLKIAGCIFGMFVLSLLHSGCAGPVGQGNLALIRGDYQGAEAIFLQVLQDNPENVTARRRLAMTYFYMGRDSEPEKFNQAVAQFMFIKERRILQPEEQFYYGLSLVGKNHRHEGFAVLKTLSHPTKFRVQQFVRQRAAQLENYGEMPLRKLIAEMEKSWREGEEEDQREKIDERFSDRDVRDLPNPLR
ncbi:MAG TPA: tetratricopeptide repeat protein [Desulfonatronum sp.]|nr:tetratricopeptide repeat protein [Desulfonatronum sp.]